VCVLRGLCGVLIVQVSSNALNLQLWGAGVGRLKVTCRIFSEYGHSCLNRRLTRVIPKIRCESVYSFSILYSF